MWRSGSGLGFVTAGPGFDSCSRSDAGAWACGAAAAAKRSESESESERARAGLLFFRLGATVFSAGRPLGDCSVRSSGERRGVCELWWACVFGLCPGAFVVCGALVRSGRARLEDVFFGWAMPVGSSSRERFGEFGAQRAMRRGPKAGGLDLRPASNEAYKNSLTQFQSSSHRS